MSERSRGLMKTWLDKGTKQQALKDPDSNPFALMIPEQDVEGVEALQRASRYEQAKAAVTRKGKKQKSYSNADKLKLCRYIKATKSTKYETLGMLVLGYEVPASTVATWWSVFNAHSENKRRWDGPEEHLEWPKTKVGRPLLLLPTIVSKMDKYFEVFQQQGARIFRQSVLYVENV